MTSKVIACSGVGRRCGLCLLLPSWHESCRLSEVPHKLRPVGRVFGRKTAARTHGCGRRVRIDVQPSSIFEIPRIVRRWTITVIDYEPRCCVHRPVASDRSRLHLAPTASAEKQGARTVKHIMLAVRASLVGIYLAAHRDSGASTPSVPWKLVQLLLVIHGVCGSGVAPFLWRGS